MSEDAIRSTEIPSGWARLKLDRFTTAPVVYGILQPGPSIPGGVPYVRPTEINRDEIQIGSLRRTTNEIASRYCRSSLQPDDIILSIVGTIGKVAIVPRALAGANITQSSARIRIEKALVSPRYVAWALRSRILTRQYDRFRLGTAVPRLNIAHVRALELPIAPLPEQHRIVAEIEKHFTRLDAAMAALERVRANLKRYRAAVLKAACEGRLVPTEAALARAEGRDYEPADELLARILEERRARWEADQSGKIQGKGTMAAREDQGSYGTIDRSHLPAVPLGWCRAALGQLLSRPLANGRSVPDASHGFPVLRLTALKRGVVDVSERKIGAWRRAAALPYLVKRGDFLVARGNGSLSLVGRGGLVTRDPGEVAYPDTLIRVRIDEGVALTSYVKVIWDSDVMRRQIEQSARTTAGIYKINQASMRGYVIPLPPPAEQHRIVAEVERRLSVIDEIEGVVDANLKRAERLRQAILKRAFEGKLVPQDPNDEPASVLLERIRAERAAAASSGRDSQHPRPRRKPARRDSAQAPRSLPLESR